VSLWRFPVPCFSERSEPFEPFEPLRSEFQFRLNHKTLQPNNQAFESRTKLIIYIIYILIYIIYILIYILIIYKYIYYVYIYLLFLYIGVWTPHFNKEFQDHVFASYWVPFYANTRSLLHSSISQNKKSTKNPNRRCYSLSGGVFTRTMVLFDSGNLTQGSFPQSRATCKKGPAKQI